MSEHPGHDDAGRGQAPEPPAQEPSPAPAQEPSPAADQARTQAIEAQASPTLALPGLPLRGEPEAPGAAAPAGGAQPSPAQPSPAPAGAASVPAYRPDAGHHNPYAAYVAAPQGAQAQAVPDAYPGAWTRPSEAPERPVGVRRGWGPALVAGAVAGALVGGVVGWGASALAKPQVISSSGGVVIQNPQSATSVTAAAAKALPSVVTISVTRGSTGGSGSGIVVDDDGHILTNQHVATLAGATAQGTIDVMTSDGRVLPAKLVGQAPLYDLAVLKVDGAGLTPAAWADLDKLNVGDVAVAIGAPLGLPNSVSNGVVSNLDRSIPVASSAVDESESSAEGDDRFSLPDQDGSSSSAKGQVSLNVIQTDASINHGNSGGALVNAAGELIGVNVAIYSPTEQGGSVGIGFAIRGDIAQRVATELIETGKASHGKLGVSIRSAPVDDNGAGTGFTDGATVADVPSGSAAARAGLRAGDVIVKVGDKRTIDATDVTATVRSYAAGTEVPITVRRGGAETVVKVTLDEASS
ncbi:MAG: trypsin-like peptidase domain-containing protein [Arthrobacter sp.]|jgi:putative serine protease PepD|nr:trypsin-like peptidase domain-containing protein [Arthrobacter sp.]